MDEVGVEHLPHAGAAFGAFITDDHDVAGLDLTVENGGGGVLFRFKDPGPCLH